MSDKPEQFIVASVLAARRKMLEHETPDSKMDAELWTDRVLFGTSFEYRDKAGTRTRLDPLRVTMQRYDAMVDGLKPEDE